MDSLSLQTVRTLVVASDLSPAAETAVEQAALLAKRWNAELVLLHVFNDSIWATIKAIYDAETWGGCDPVLAARNRLSQQARELNEKLGIKVRSETRTGHVAMEIATYCREQEVQLLVVGEHGENWIGDAVFGGTALKVLSHAQLPVLLVRRAVSPESSCILLATDFSANATRAAQLSIDWFPDAQQHLVHAYAVAFEGRMRMAGVSPENIERYRIDELTRAEQTMQEQMRTLRSKNRIGWLLVHGYPATVLLREAERYGADMVVIGKHGGTMLDENLLGSVPQNVLYHAHCNVLLVP